MDAMDGTLRSRFLRESGARFSISAALAVSILLALVIGVFLFVRRVTGALSVPIPALQLVATAAGLCMWAVVVHELAERRRVYFWLPLCAVVLFAIGCSYPANRLVDWLVWIPAFGVVIASSLALRMKEYFSRRHSSRVTGNDETCERILQELQRVRTAEGRDSIRGTLLAEFAAGERQTTVYVGFCPPFELLPQVDLNVAGDFEADIKLAQVLHNGAQLDVRLSEPAEEAVAVSVEICAIESGELLES